MKPAPETGKNRLFWFAVLYLTGLLSLSVVAWTLKLLLNSI
jgi:hypothetical protein